MTERETKERREEAMAQQLRFNCMHFMPYAHLPENHKDYKSVWVNLSNKHYDPDKGTRSISAISPSWCLPTSSVTTRWW
jgi:hypothetical protein